MKRTLSIILSLAMLLSMFTVFFTATSVSVAAAVTVSKASPAITADVGDTINLSNYSVEFDNGTVSSSLTWKNGSSAITSFTPEAKGVTELTATDGTNTKTIYVVAKNASESEYVLYEANLADFASVDALKNAGWSFECPVGGTYTKASDGSLNFAVTGGDNPGYSVAYAYLPTWLGDFGDFCFEADVKIASTINNDASRWLSLIYRSDNNTSEGHYFQLAIRDNGNIELAERYENAWNVISSSTTFMSSMSSAYNTLKIQAVGGNVRYDINNTQALYVASATYASGAKSARYSGNLGLSMCGGALNVKSVKVTVQETVPEEIVNTELLNNDRHEMETLVNPVANVQKITEINAETLDGLTVAFFNASSDSATMT